MYRRDLRPEIVEAFIEEWNGKGAKLTLDAVCARMHISKKTIYRFFDSKDEIYRYILSDATQLILAEQKRIFDDASMPTKEKLKAILTIKTSWEEKIHLERASSLADDSPKVYQDLLNAYQTHWEIVASLLEKAQKEGVIKPEVNIPLTIAFLRTGMSSLYEGETLLKAGISYTEAIEKLSEVVLGGILVQEKN